MESVKEVVKHLGQALARFKAPPFNDRPLNFQEFETILCKWKSHQNGHYPIGKDIEEISHTLDQWKEVSPTAGRLLTALKENTRGVEQ